MDVYARRKRADNSMDQSTIQPLEQRDAGNLLDLMRVAVPLILSTSGHAIRMFADRVMVAQYSSSAIKASLQAGVTSYMIICFFHGILFYTSTFVSQYTGAKRDKEIGRIIWTAVTFGAVAGMLLPLMQLISHDMFTWMGGANELSEVIRDEVIYFNILNGYCYIWLIMAPIQSFWTGRGKTYVVMAVELSVAALNVFFNWLLIFGNWGAPELGIRGAGMATVLSASIGLSAYLVMFLLIPANRKRFGTFPKQLFHFRLFRRLIRFGGPNGTTLFLDLVNFTVFVTILGRIGHIEREASNMAFSVNLIMFLPMIGIGSGAGVLVGQGIGAEDISRAKRAVRSALTMALVYSLVTIIFLIVTPDLILNLFRRPGDSQQLIAMAATKQLFWFLAAYIAFEGVLCVYRAAINAAGDTRWSMLASIVLGWSTFLVPCLIASWLFEKSGLLGTWSLEAKLFTMWSLFVSHVVVTALAFRWRYNTEKWTEMRVIEHVPTELEGDVAGAPLHQG